MNISEKRNRFVSYIKKQLIGFDLEDDILNNFQPLKRFHTGFIFPQLENSDEIHSIECDGDDASNDDEDGHAQPIVKRKKYMPPSSVGFSFYISGSTVKLRVYCNAVRYKLQDSGRDKSNQKYVRKVWEKKKFDDSEKEIEFSPNGLAEYAVLDDKARLDVVWRKHKSGYIATVTLSNTQLLSSETDANEYSVQRNTRSLFEVELKCIIQSGIIEVYPVTNRDLLNREEKEIELRYQDAHVYAVGHGAAVNWKTDQYDQMEIWSDYIPTVEIPQVTANISGLNEEVLKSSYLMNCSKDESVIEQLFEFVDRYEEWIEGQKEEAFNEDDKETASNIVANLVAAKDRMRSGVLLLEECSLSRDAFSTMNEAMLLQWNPDSLNASTPKSEFVWRPFQLGFILQTIESTINEDSDFRDTLDLIWFPTGGGKTEAYLGLLSFLLLYRRTKYPASYGGTVAIMRYTLRLLTTQQFIRANKVIFALEILRQGRQDKYGNEPFSVGLWMGNAISPNSFDQAQEILVDEKYGKFVINKCPWCNCKFDNAHYIAKQDRFNFLCLNEDCFFYNKILPCNVVDEALYNNPPSLLIATVDKIARLAWEERASCFFGINGNRPPELIIQDELHLIGGALGSIVGLYEVAIDSVLINRGIHAKYIASTATIKNASRQVRALFARDASIFPQPGLRFDDSYFAKIVPLDEKPGRLYVGFLAPLLNRQHCLEPLLASVLSAPLVECDSDDKDNWWTQIIYHGSLKEVSNSRTLLQGSVKDYFNQLIIEKLRMEIDEKYPGFTNDKRLNTLNDYEEIKKEEIVSITKKYLPLRDIKVEALTSKQTAEENAEIFSHLERGYNEKGSIDVAIATNMISVGLDVSRLALMIINGQPHTTAEYIQASSRVGRSEVPGIVFANYYKTQARSVSHYENFKSYHETFYRYVEPSSLTPFTYQARKRALHAAIVIAMRHSNIGLLKNSDAKCFRSEEQSVKKVIETIKKRCEMALYDDSESVKNIFDHIEELVETWSGISANVEEAKRELVYWSNDKGSDNILCNFREENGMWETLQSMRNVEHMAMVKVLGDDNYGE